MKILIDVVHPADVLFFKRPIERFAEQDCELLVLSRHKDVTCELLDEFDIAHVPVSRAGVGLIGLGSEMLRRSAAIAMAARRFRPNVMLGFGGVSISHAGKLLGIPSVSFYDTENATLQTRVTWPFITHVFVPQTYKGPTPPMRTTRIPGIKELSYLHPNGFRPNRTTALEAGLDPDQENFLVRLVAWRANHDIGKQGWDSETLLAVVDQLPGRVHISSEVPLPDELEPLRYRGKLSAIHHLMAFCRLFVGESASMAAEAAILGIPSIYSADFALGYIDELVASGLMYQSPPRLTLEAINAALARKEGDLATARERYISEKPDWSTVVVNAAKRFAA